MSKPIHVAVDFNSDYRKAGGPVQPANIVNLMARFAELGLERVYWIHNAEDYYIGKSLTDEGTDLLAYAADAAHRHGLQFWGLYKPFETGRAAMEIPHEVRLPEDRQFMEGIAGRAPYMAPFVLKHPELRLKRFPARSCTGIAIACVKLVKSDDLPTRLGRDDIELFSSPINGRFVRYRGRVQFSDTIEDRQSLPVRVLILAGLEIPADHRYLLVVPRRRSGEGDFSNREDRLLEIYDAKGNRLPATPDEGLMDREELERLLRHYYLLQWGQQTIPEDRFPKGFGEDEPSSALILDSGHAPTTRTLDGNEGPRDGYAGVAKGKPIHVGGALHPTYPEVRRYWLKEIENRLLAAGADGIDIRFTQHSAWTSEGPYYGFNEPVVEEFRSRYGVDVLTEPYDKEAFRKLQGEYLTQFMREVRSLLNDRGLPLQAHVNYFMERKIPGWNRNNLPVNFDYEWRRWLREDIVDSVCLKYLPMRLVETEDKGEDLLEEVIRVAGRWGKRVEWELRLDRIIHWSTVMMDPESTAAIGFKAVSPESKAAVETLRRDFQWGLEHEGVDAIILYESAGFTLMDRNTGETHSAPFMKSLLDSMRT